MDDEKNSPREDNIIKMVNSITEQALEKGKEPPTPPTEWVIQDSDGEVFKVTGYLNTGFLLVVMNGDGDILYGAPLGSIKCFYREDSVTVVE